MARLVTAEWVASNLQRLRIFDGSWYLPAMQRNARQEYLARHIPGARFFDIDDVADKATKLPHMLPTPAQFGDFVGSCGVGNDDHVIVYDGIGAFSAARVYWTFRAFGHDKISLLDGGLPVWQQMNLATDSGEPAPANPKSFKATLRPELVRNLEQVLKASKAGDPLIVDVRPLRRWQGLDPEPRPIPSGHMPNSISIPMPTLVTPDMRHLKPAEELRKIFAAAGVTPDKQVIFSCGSGVNACTAELAARVAGFENVSVFDGSWVEYASRPDAVILKSQ